MEIKYLRKMLVQVDARISTPQSLSGDALREKLDGIPVPRAQRRDWRRFFSPQSGVTYAVAFALMIALFFSLEYYSPDMINDVLHIAPSGSEASAAGELQSAEPTAASVAAFALPVNEEPDAGAEISSSPEAVLFLDEPAETFGVGGGGEAVLLLTQDMYSYYYRVNDTTDPDKQAFPVTLEIADTAAGLSVAQIDIPDMNSVERLFVQGDKLIVVGVGETGLVTRSYGLANPGSPEEQLMKTQPGEFVDARIYKDIVHIVTATDAVPQDCETVALPGAEASDSCVITAVNVSTLETGQKAFSGAKGTVQLYNLNAYIHYEGENENGELRQYIGQVLFEGIDIALGTTAETVS